jgi:hypothetical protein
MGYWLALGVLLSSHDSCGAFSAHAVHIPPYIILNGVPQFCNGSQETATDAGPWREKKSGKSDTGRL